MKLKLLTLLAAAGIALAACDESSSLPTGYVESLSPDWDLISAWPGELSDDTQLIDVDPRRTTTVIVFDDSSSMGSGINPAKDSVVTAINGFPANDRIGLLALNKGMLLNIEDARTTSATIQGALDTVRSSGSTPLGARIEQAMDMLAQDAKRQRGFGQYRILVVTDGAASDGDKLLDVLRVSLSQTPVQIATIGLGVGQGHVLNLPGHTTYVDVSKPEDLAQAMAALSAEDTSFDPITSFE